jgi:hypothetical protein
MSGFVSLPSADPEQRATPMPKSWTRRLMFKERTDSREVRSRGVQHDATKECSTALLGWRGFFGGVRDGWDVLLEPRPCGGHQEPHRRVRRPRQGDRAHLPSRNSAQSDGGVRGAQGDAAGLRLASADRGAEHDFIRRGRRGEAHRRGAAHLHRLDVRREPRPSRRGAPRLRRLADQLQDGICSCALGEQRERAAGRSPGPGC